MVLGNSKGLVSGGLLSWCDLDTQHSGAVVVAVCKKKFIINYLHPILYLNQEELSLALQSGPP